MKYPQELLNPIKTFLEEKKAELEGRLARLLQEDPFSNTDRLNDNAAVDADAAEQFGHETVVAMKEEIDRKMVDVLSALKRIEEGTYGTCTLCGSMIDTDRLKVDPTVEHCVDCQRSKTATS